MQQSYQSHTRIDPLFHRTGMPLVLIGLIVSIIALVTAPAWTSVGLVVVTLAVVFAYVRLRTYATTLQDRIIRAEENFRHFRLAGAPIDPGLTPRQIVALRFAGDDEFVDLCRRAAAEGMTPDAIKQAVRTWRADHLRV